MSIADDAFGAGRGFLREDTEENMCKAHSLHINEPHTNSRMCTSACNVVAFHRSTVQYAMFMACVPYGTFCVGKQAPTLQFEASAKRMNEKTHQILFIESHRLMQANVCAVVM